MKKIYISYVLKIKQKNNQKQKIKINKKKTNKLLKEK